MRQEGVLINNVLSYELSSTATQIREVENRLKIMCSLHMFYFATYIKELISLTLLALASSYLHKIPPSTFIRLDLQFSFIVSFRITLQMFYICINQY